MLGSPTGVTVSVVADAPAELAIADRPGAPVTVTQLVDGTKVWVEATWQAPR